jgi:alpha-galactosidase
MEYVISTGILYSCQGGTWGQVGTGAGGPPTGSASGVLSGNYPGPGLSASPQAIPNGWTATTQLNPYDYTTDLATDAFAVRLTNLQMANTPLSGITGGTYSFNSACTGILADLTASSGVITGVLVSIPVGSGCRVGDVVTFAGGNYDALLKVHAINGSGQPTSYDILYGGTGYSSGTAAVGSGANAIQFTWVLSGTLTSPATFVGPFGSLITTGNQWNVFNNTTGAYSVTFCQASSAGANTCGGRSVVIPQGTANSAGAFINTDGIANIDCVSGSCATSVTTNALTMNNSGSGAASGTTFNGSAAQTLSYNTIGAAALAGAAFTGAISAPLATVGTSSLDPRIGFIGPNSIPPVLPSNAGAHNLLEWSEGFSNPGQWYVFLGLVARTIGSLAPSGQMDGVLVTENGTSTTNYGVLQSIPLAPITKYTLSVWAANYPTSPAYYLILYLSENSTVHTMDCDVATGTLGTINTNTVSRTIEPQANGYIRCDMAFQTTAATTSGNVYVIESSTESNNDTGVVGRGLYLWGAQVTASTGPLPYTATDFPTLVDLPYDKLTPTPPMVWDCWVVFGPSCTQTEIQAQAALLVSTGLAAKGYTGVSINNSWEASTRDANGNLQPNANYPSGMSSLSAYVHSLGLLMWGYDGPGPTTCNGTPGSYMNEFKDARTFASWNWDALFYDYCSHSTVDDTLAGIYGPIGLQEIYQRLGLGIRAAGRPMIMNSSTLNVSNPEIWSPLAGYDGRYIGTADTYGTWTYLDNTFDQMASISSSYTGPGNWPNAGFTFCGLGWTDTECMTGMSLFSIYPSQLWIGNDLSSVTALVLSRIGNTAVIAVNQDAAGVGGMRISQAACGSTYCEVWARQLTGTNTCAIGLFNRDNSAHNITATFATIASAIPACGSGPYTTTEDLWAGTSPGTLTTSYTATSVPAHGVVLLRVAP